MRRRFPVKRGMTMYNEKEVPAYFDCAQHRLWRE